MVLWYKVSMRHCSYLQKLKQNSLTVKHARCQWNFVRLKVYETLSLGTAMKTKLIELSRECHNQKPQPTNDTKRKRKRTNETAHEIMAFIALRKLNLQTRMRSNLLALHVWYLVRSFVYFHTLCVWKAKALVRPRGCAVSLEPSLFAYGISTIISWAGSNIRVPLARWSQC